MQPLAGRSPLASPEPSTSDTCPEEPHCRPLSPSRRTRENLGRPMSAAKQNKHLATSEKSIEATIRLVPQIQVIEQRKRFTKTLESAIDKIGNILTVFLHGTCNFQKPAFQVVRYFE